MSPGAGGSVPGDRIALEAGDSVPADARLIRGFGLRMQETALRRRLRRPASQGGRVPSARAGHPEDAISHAAEASP